jgi:hypothetical protein
MALLKFGGGITEMRGSIGGTTFAKNRYGSYARNRTKPVNPNSTRQGIVRAIMSTLYTAWAALTAAVQGQWKAYADNVKVLNRLGEQINLSGYNMYCRTKAVFENAGLTMPATAPTTFSLPAQDPTVVPTPDASSSNVSIAFDNTLPWAGAVGGAMIVSQGLPVNPTVNFFKGPFRYAGKIDGAATPPTSPQVVALPLPMQAGQKVFLQIRIAEADGRVSNPFHCSGIVQS